MLVYMIFLSTAPNAEENIIEKNINTAYIPRYIKNIEVKNYNITGVREDLYKQMPMRVIAVGENINETLVALGVENKVICAVNYGNLYYVPEQEYAERYSKLKFENRLVLNTESILLMNPDLIISGQSVFSDKGVKDTAFWNQRDIHTFLAFNANAPASRKHKETLELEYEFVLGLGAIFDKEAVAREFVTQMQSTIDRIAEKTKMLPKPKVMIVEQLGKSMIAYDDTKLAGDICTRLGAIVPKSPLGTIGLEYLLEEDPDVIFVVKSGGDPQAAAEIFKNTLALQSLKAIKNNRVYGIGLNYTYNSAIKTGAGIKKFARGIYPELEKTVFEEK